MGRRAAPGALLDRILAQHRLLDAAQEVAMENQNRESVATPVADLLVGDEASELAARNQQAAALLGGWLEEDNAYDAEIWPLMEQELAELRTRVGD